MGFLAEVLLPHGVTFDSLRNMCKDMSIESGKYTSISISSPLSGHLKFLKKYSGTNQLGKPGLNKPCVAVRYIRLRRNLYLLKTWSVTFIL